MTMIVTEGMITCHNNIEGFILLKVNTFNKFESLVASDPIGDVNLLGAQMRRDGSPKDDGTLKRVPPEESMKRRQAKDEMRDDIVKSKYYMYKMLSDNLKAMVKMKIRKLKKVENNNNINGEGGKEKMKEALQKIFV
ncbi:hypothetical protein L6452_27901 [Arctium lappa]|uniref:Uncharacterized protein n=1 Tax=Arctium lappa TaxID=4217 RepID=A0ACB9A1B2_ARCLA|nr:hypothetical protein L6452_27901 [Arctium lappa]